MSLLFWKKKNVPRLTREESFGAVVAQNPSLRATRNADGVVTLYAPFRATPFVAKLSKWLKAPEGAGEAKIELDEIGTFVWDLCDGKTTVRDMIALLAEKHKLNRKEAEASLTEFIRSLAQRRLVAVVILKPGESEAPRS